MILSRKSCATPGSTQGGLWKRASYSAGITILTDRNSALPCRIT
jgi:hypothetical protein